MSSGYDVVIVATNLPCHEEFWYKKLRSWRGTLCKSDALILTVAEEWPGGAGNGLGALYAYQKAIEKGRYRYHFDLLDMQKKGASVALYLAAGEGRGIFPLIASEEIDPAGIVLPTLFDNRPLTLLEGALRQTAPLAKGRGSRLSVFYCDQQFIPEKLHPLAPKNHIEIFSLPYRGNTTHGRGVIYEKNGRILVGKKGMVLPQPLAISIGSFSLSFPFFLALLREFNEELATKRGHFESIAHFWMPLSFEEESYQHHFPTRAALEHFRRMNRFKQKFSHLHSSSNFLGHSTLGARACWWDYGTTRAYYESMLKFASPTIEGEKLRLFYRIQTEKNEQIRAIMDDTSCLINCKIRSGKIFNSVLVGVDADSVEVENCVIVNSTFSRIHAEEALLYRVKEELPLKLAPGTVRADTLLPKTNETLKIYSHLSRNSKMDWESLLPANTHTFEQIFRRIHSSHQNFIL